MDLCHSVTLEKNAQLSHVVCSIESIDAISKDQVLLNPCKMSFNTFWFASLRAHDADLPEDVVFNRDWSVILTLSIVDDLEKKPLLYGYSPTRSILLLGEIIRNIIEGLLVFGLKAPFCTPRPEAACLDIGFVVPKGSFSYQVLGSAMGLSTLIDSLLFERGLLCYASDVVISEKQILEQQLFIALYRRILATLNACSL